MGLAAEQNYHQALATAKRQSAKTLELRAASSLAADVGLTRDLRLTQTGLRHISNQSRACRNGNWKTASRDWRRKATTPHLRAQNLSTGDLGVPA
jgi:hypothetical protein